MSKPMRSPVLGYNHNLRYRGRLFHVQSEDSGPGNPRVFTHLFYEGTILSSKKQEYDAEIHEDTVKLLMQQLHKTMIRELTHGEHDARITAFFAARGQLAFTEAPPATASPAPAAPAAPLAVAAADADARVVQVAGVAAGAAGPTRRPSPVPQPQPRPNGAARPMVVVKPTDIRRPPMVFSQSADGVVVQRSVVVGVGSATEPHHVRARPSGPFVVREGSHPQPSAADAAGRGAPASSSAPVPRGRTPSPIDKPFSDLVSDKSLDEVILEYLSDDGEPQDR
jgi:hypothetical protein